MTIANNLRAVRSTISRLADRPVTLVVVTKGRTTEEVKQIVEAGATNIGESRLQEAKAKFPHLPTGLTKHFIGHLQGNKIRDIVRLFDMIQSVDSLRSAKKIDEECEKIGKIMPVLLQVNVSGQPQQGGALPADTSALLEAASALPHLQIKGLMAIAPRGDEKTIKNGFIKLKKLYDELQKNPKKKVQFSYLSMGMSLDYALAIQEGATMVRIGKGVFEG